MDLDSIIRSNEFTILDFYGEHCAPCRNLLPIFDKLQEKYTQIKFVKINVDENLEEVKKFKVMSVPCLLFFKSEELCYQHLGPINEERFVMLIEDELLKK